MSTGHPGRRPLLFLLLALAGVLGAVACGDRGEARPAGSRAARRPAFDSTELERYRVDIHPVTPDSGIMTGYVFAYGYYIAPPYRVTAEAGTTRVNGVRVEPLITLPPRLTPKSPWLESEVGKRWLDASHAQNVAIARAFAVFNRLRPGVGYLAAVAAARSVLVTEPVVESIRVVGPGLVDVYGPTVEDQRGAMRSIQQGVDFGDSTLRTDKPTREEMEKHMQFRAELEASGLRRDLPNGATKLYSSGMAGTGPGGIAHAAAIILSDQSLSTAQLWESLVDAVGLDAAYGFAANRDAAAPGWAALTRRIESER